MPAYDYKCDNCGVFEVRQSIKDEALGECPTCGSAVKRLISRNVNILFKGPGFYVTDNKSSSHSTTTSNGNGSAPATDSSTAATASSNKETKGSDTTSTATSNGSANGAANGSATSSPAAVSSDATSSN